MRSAVLRAGRDRSVRRRHPWVMSGSVGSLAEGPDGDWVRVSSKEGELLGFGLHSPSSIRIRMLCFGGAERSEDECEALLAERIAASVARRRDDALVGDTDAIRLVNAEGDGLPGLVADRYAEVCVVRMTTVGMLARRERVAEALRVASGLAYGFERGDPRASRGEGVEPRMGPLWGELRDPVVEIRERDRRFEVDLARGQKTGFYLDQRDARDLVARLAAGRRVLDLFSYTGGFAVAAAKGAAASVTLVDSSEVALDQARRHLERNAAACDVALEKSDGFEYMRRTTAAFDLLVVDPPPLARNQRDVPKAARAYKDLVLHALRAATPAARLLVFACSHHVGPDLFRKIVFGASIDARRSVRVLATLGAPGDHPVSIDHPEGQYLNGLLLEVGEEAA